MQTNIAFLKEFKSIIYKDAKIGAQWFFLFDILWIVLARYPCKNQTLEFYFGQRKIIVLFQVWEAKKFPLSSFKEKYVGNILVDCGIG